MKRIGEDVSEVLDYVPARFRVIRHVRPKLACPSCERIVQIEAPSRPIDRGLAARIQRAATEALSWWPTPSEYARQLAQKTITVTAGL